MLQHFMNRITGVLFDGGHRRKFGNTIVFVSIVLPVFILAAFSYVRTRQDLTSFTLSRRESIAYLAAKTLQQKFDQFVQIGISLATRVRFSQLVANGEWAEAAQILKSVSEDFPSIEAVMLANVDGALMISVPPLAYPERKSFASEDWYRGVARDWQPYVSGVYQRLVEPRQNVVAVAVPIKAPERGVVGLLALKVRTNELLKWAREIDLGQSGFVYFVDRKGLLAAHPRLVPQQDVFDYSGIPAVRKVLEGRKGVEILMDPVEREEAVTAYAPVARYGWGVIAVEPTGSAFAARDRELRFDLAIYGAILLFTGGLACLILVMLHRLKQAENRAHEARDYSDAIIDTVRESLLVLDWSFQVVRANRSFYKTFGLSEMETRHRPLPELGRGEWNIPGLSDLLQQVFSSGRSLEDFEITREFPGIGRKTLVISGWRFYGHDGARMVLLAIEDISERKQAEEEVARLNESLKQRASELELVNKELEAFSYSVSHDLRSPLRGIDGFSRALLEDYGEKLDADGKDYLQRVRAASQHMGRLIDDLLKLARVTRKELRKEKVDLSKLAEAVVKELRGQNPERQVEFALAEGVFAEGDPGLLGVALENLLGNAWKFTNRRPRARIMFGTTSGNGTPAYYVSDNGVGFDMAYADKIFGAFQRLHHKKEFDGTGVGLATVQRIVHRHGGTIWAESAPGAGTTFFFTLKGSGHGDEDDTAGGR